MFKNITVFTIQGDALDAVEPILAQAVHDADESFTHFDRPLGPMELRNAGFGPVVDDRYCLPIPHRGAFLFNIVFREKVLPASVIGSAVATEVRRIQSEESRQVGGKERRRIRAQVTDALLPKALTKTATTGVIVDLNEGRVLIDTASRAVAEVVLRVFRDNLGSFPALPFQFADHVATSPDHLMHGWLSSRGDSLPEGFGFGDEVVLLSPTNRRRQKWSGTGVDLAGEEVHSLVTDGFIPDRLSLEYADRIGFVLQSDLVLRKFRMFDVAEERMDGLCDDNDPVSLLQAGAFLLLDEVSPVLDFAWNGFSDPYEEELL